jgi:hypothetical protein
MKKKQRKHDDDLAVLVVGDGNGPVPYTVPAELAPEATPPLFQRLKLSELDNCRDVTAEKIGTITALVGAPRKQKK